MRLRSITNCDMMVAEQFSIEAMPSGSGWVAAERLSPGEAECFGRGLVDPTSLAAVESTVESLSRALRDMQVPFTGPVFVARLAIN
jgi:hypothetical protein